MLRYGVGTAFCIRKIQPSELYLFDGINEVKFKFVNKGRVRSGSLSTIISLLVEPFPVQFK